jgi:hypothetical protein
MSVSKQQSRFSLSEKNHARLNTVLLIGVAVVAIVALVYAVKEYNTPHSPSAVEKMTVKVAKDALVDRRNADRMGAPGTYKDETTTDDGYNFWSSTNGGNRVKVYDGNDAANALMGGAAQNTCAPVAIAEPAHPNTSSFGGPSMQNAAIANAAAYPDETAANSLAGKVTYSCAPDITNVGGCDYAINPDNLMPGSWREGVSCSDGTDPNSQWAKYHPTRDKYYRYITAAGSARLGAGERNNNRRKVIGLQNSLRSATVTSITPGNISPFNDSSARLQVIFDSHGHYGQETGALCQ